MMDAKVDTGPVDWPVGLGNVRGEDLPKLTDAEQREEAQRIYDALCSAMPLNGKGEEDGVGGLLAWITDGHGFESWRSLANIGPDEVEAARAQWDGGFRETGFWPPDRLYVAALARGWRYPIVVDDNRLDWMVRKAERVLWLGGSAIYRQGFRLVRLLETGGFTEVKANWLRAELTRVINWQKAGQERLQLERRVGCGVPREVVGAIMERRGEWTFPNA